MKVILRKYALAFMAAALLAGGLVVVFTSTAAGPINSANGQGTLLVPDGNGGFVRRTFSFSAQKKADGTVTGNAVLHNPQYTYGNGNQPYMVQVDISCMKVIGNTAFFGGMPRRSNDPNPIYLDAAFFSAQDNGEPGRGNDKVSLLYFEDNLPPITGNPQECLGIQPGDFEMLTIDAGNIQVK